MRPSKEVFDAWYNNDCQDKSYADSPSFEAGYQAAEAHYQPLLDAKDAEIAKLERKLHFYVSTEPAVSAEGQRLQDENTNLKALLEQARIALESTLYGSEDAPWFDMVYETIAVIDEAKGE